MSCGSPSVDPEHQILQFHTDADSLKCQSLRHNPKAQILIWNETVSIQLRLSVEVNLRQDAESQALWQQVPSPSQIAYGKALPQAPQFRVPMIMIHYRRRINSSWWNVMSQR